MLRWIYKSIKWFEKVITRRFQKLQYHTWIKGILLKEFVISNCRWPTLTSQLYHQIDWVGKIKWCTNIWNVLSTRAKNVELGLGSGVCDYRCNLGFNFWGVMNIGGAMIWWVVSKHSLVIGWFLQSTAFFRQLNPRWPLKHYFLWKLT